MLDRGQRHRQELPAYRPAWSSTRDGQPEAAVVDVAQVVESTGKSPAVARDGTARWPRRACDVGSGSASGSRIPRVGEFTGHAHQRTELSAAQCVILTALKLTELCKLRTSDAY